LSDIAFRHLVLAAKWLTVSDAADKYGVTRRTVRTWLARWPISVKINGATHRISEPLLDLCISDDPDERAAVADFLNGKPAGAPVCRAFDRCGVLRALEVFEFERARPAMEWLAVATKCP
jgi:Homeodomain-like domain